MNIKQATEDTFCHYCGDDIKKGQDYHEVVALLPKKCCISCEESAQIRRRESEIESYIDTNDDCSEEDIEGFIDTNYY
jgi:hypothetical protein